MRKILTITSHRWGKLSYRKNGDFPGTALLLIHGAVGDSRLYRHQLRHFGASRTTIALDLPGHGHSHNEKIPTLDDFIDAIEDVVAAEGITSFVLVGHSMGGGVSLEAWRRGVTGLCGLVLVSTSPKLPVSKELVGIIERNDTNALAELIVGAVFSKKVDLLIGFAKKGLEEMDREIIQNDVLICKTMDYTDRLSEIRIPVLVIANSGDQVISSEMTTALHDGIEGSQLVVFDMDGHVPFFESPHAFNEAVDKFLYDIS